MRQRILVILIGLAGFFGLILPKVFAQQPNILATILNIKPAIVSVKAYNTDIYKSPEGTAAIDEETGRVVIRRNLKAATFERFGAGVLIHINGIVITNLHNVNGANQISVQFHDGIEVRARVMRVEDGLDLAYLQIPLPYPIEPVEFADSNKIKLGDEIITVGNSQILNQTITGGKIRGLGTKRDGKGGKRVELIQTSFNVYKGDSGGPVFDLRGRLIGLMTASEIGQDHSSFAIPSNRISMYLEEHLKSTN